jgi:hypothetical protein
MVRSQLRLARLQPCMNWCFTACKDDQSQNFSSSTSPQPPAASTLTLKSNNCATPKVYIAGANPEEYEGFVNELKCFSAQCICRLENRPLSLQTIYDCGRLYCNLRIGTAAFPDEDFSKTLGVLAQFCSDARYLLPEWILDIGKNYGNILTNNSGER